MNFFGHAIVASWNESSAEYVLGAMLPDLVSMIRARLPPLATESLRGGVSHHHVVDRIFHDTRRFRQLCMAAATQLAHLGLDRGRARAAAHVGTEILLDDVLAGDTAGYLLYRQALVQAGPAHLGRHLLWGDADRARFERLRAALQERSDHRRGTSEKVVAYRLERALQSRPRLALSPHETHAVAQWCTLARAEVARGAHELLGELVDGLLAQPKLRLGTRRRLLPHSSRLLVSCRSTPVQSQSPPSSSLP